MEIYQIIELIIVAAFGLFISYLVGDFDGNGSNNLDSDNNY